MAGTAIVAIPALEDPVWEISSEKIPHLTILFLGDQSKNPQLQSMIDFIQHVTESGLTRFSLSVDRRGTLGPENADVLFFEKERWNIQDVATARGYMLANPDILAAYQSTQQFEQWEPHLTLGFPDKPAKKMNERIWSVQFNQLAVWTGDFTGPTFDLAKHEWDLLMSEAMEKVLEHHGVKGMRWGVRKDSHGVRRGTPTAHPDAVRAKVAQQKVKKGSTDVLSNDELKDLVTRLGLEKQFSALKEPTVARKGGKVVADILLSVGKQQVNRAVNDQASKQITRLLANASK